MKSTILALAGVLMCSMLFATNGFAAEEQEGFWGQGDYYKGYNKEEHMKAFPQGHPKVNNLNKCIWDEESSLYFCQYDVLRPRN